MLRNVKHTTTVLTTLLAAGCMNAAAHATIVPFIEGFEADAANWFDGAGATELGWSPSGGPDGSAHATTQFNFLNAAPGSFATIFRGQDNFDSSNDAFVGNWIADGVNQLSFAVRHDAPTPISFFTRLASPFNFPGVAAIEPVAVDPDTWTTITLDIVEGNPAFVFEGPFGFSDVFSNIGNVQFGIVVPGELAGADLDVTFDLDNVSIVPSPAGFALLIGAGMLQRRRRR